MSCRHAMLAVALVLALLALAGPASSIGPPPRAVRLTPEQARRLDHLHADRNKAAYAGEMGQALRLSQEVESLHRRWLGPGHWETIDARYAVARWRRLARLAAAVQKDAGRALQRHAAGGEPGAELYGFAVSGLARDRTLRWNRGQGQLGWQQRPGSAGGVVAASVGIDAHQAHSTDRLN